MGLAALLIVATAQPSTWRASGTAFPVPTVTSNAHEAKTPASVDDLYPVISERWGRNPSVKDEMDVSNAAGFAVAFPHMGPDYKLQLAVTNPLQDGNSYVWLFYSPRPLTPDTTINRFWEQAPSALIIMQT